jgi:hypothetical protein
VIEGSFIYLRFTPQLTPCEECDWPSDSSEKQTFTGELFALFACDMAKSGGKIISNLTMNAAQIEC